MTSHWHIKVFIFFLCELPIHTLCLLFFYWFIFFSHICGTSSYYTRDQSFVDYVDCNYLLSICGLSSQLVYGVFCHTKAFYFSVNWPIFSFMLCPFCVLRNSSLSWCYDSFLLCYSYIFVFYTWIFNPSGINFLCVVRQEVNFNNLSSHRHLIQYNLLNEFLFPMDTSSIEHQVPSVSESVSGKFSYSPYYHAILFTDLIAHS